MQIKSKIYRSFASGELGQDLRILRNLFRETRTSIFAFLIPAVFSLLTAFFEGLSLGLLIPLVKGVIEENFAFFLQLPYVGQIGAELIAFTGRPFATSFVFLLLVIFASALIKNSLQYVVVLALSRQVMDFSHRLRSRLFSRFLGFGKFFFDKTSVGNLVDLLLGYVGNMAEILRNIGQFMVQLLCLIIYVTIMLLISWQVTLVSLLAFPLVHGILNWIIKKIRRSSVITAQVQKALSRKITNTIMGIPLVKLSNLENAETEEFESLSSRMAKIRHQMTKKTEGIPVVQEVITIVIFLFLVGFMAWYKVQSGAGDLAAYLVFFLLLRRALSSVNGIGRFISLLAQLHGPLQQINYVFENQDKHVVPEGSSVFKKLETGIRFKNLQFSYGERPVFNGLNFFIKKGQMTALVGHTGSGKSTIAHLLVRFYDCPPDSIFLDQSDIRSFTSASIRDQIYLVSQESLLFNGTLRMNLCYGVKSEVKENVMQDVLKKACLDDLVFKLPKGLESEVGERGIQLSSGERQRVAIARCMLKNPEVIIFDESTSALDSKTEDMVQRAIDTASSGKTTLIIAHRLSTIRKADHIIVLENGSVAEQGSMAELLDANGKFSTFWHMQRLDKSS